MDRIGTISTAGPARLMGLLLVLCALLWGLPTVAASPAQQAVIEGPIEEVAFSVLPGDPQFIQVQGTVIQLPAGFDTTQLEIGTRVRTTGQQQGSVFIASSVTIIDAAPRDPDISQDASDDNDGSSDDNDNDGNSGDDNDNGSNNNNDNG